MSCLSTNADFRPAQYNISIWRNDTWSQVMVITANEVPVSLVGSEVEIQVRKKPNADTAEMTLTETNGGITVGGVNNNQITINYPVDIAAGTYVYDMVVVFPNGNEKTYIWGNFIVYEDITKI
ncbi:MAG: hypothetical protein RL158_999 [Bacteroidota bacterium]|jgi:hypothetical protein